ncbi:protein kinase [Mariniblastus sp.]|nr:protein kinase [Mariniblastus sp.]
MRIPKVIRFNGEDLEVLEGHQIRGEKYFTVGRFSRPPRQTDRVLKELSKNRHEVMVLHRLADDPESWRLIQQVKKFTRGRTPFPKIEAVARQSGEIMVVRDFVDGKSLRWHLRMKKEISVFQAIRIYQQLVGQTFFLHRSLGIVHGDLAPENIIVSELGASATLIDFGSSFPFSKSANHDVGDGSRETYQAPENLAGQPASRISEQFSIAAIFYEMLTRKTPFNIAAKRDFKVRPPSLQPASEIPASDQKIPPELWDLIDLHLTTSLSLDCSGRFPTLDKWQASVKDLRIKSEHPELLQLASKKPGLIERLLELLSRG